MRKSNVIYQKNKKSGVVYAYEDHPYWDSEKKQSRSKRKLLGKVDPLTGDIIPTRERKVKETLNQTTIDQATKRTTNLFDAGKIINKVLVFFRLFMCETIAKRVISILLIAVGLPNSRVVELTGLCDKSVCTLKKGLEIRELDSMFHVAGGGRKRKLSNVEGLVIEEVNTGNFHSHQQIADMIHEKYGIKVSLPVIGRLLKKTELGA